MAAEDAAGIELMEVKDGHIPTTDTARHASLVTPGAHGKFNRVRSHVGHGADVNIKDKFGRTPLHKEAACGSVETVRGLVNRGADVNVQDKMGWTPIHRAFYHDNFDTMMYLVEHAGADVNLQCELGRTLLHQVMYYNEGREAHRAKFLLDHGADPNIKDNGGWVPLHAACQLSNYDIKYFVDHGADVNAKDDDARTALHWIFCAYQVNSGALKYLVNHGAVVNTRDRTGATPLYLAAASLECDDDGTVKYIINHGAESDVNVKNAYGRTPLHVASVKGHPWIMQTLYDHGADFNIKDDDGWTPLHLAAQSGSLETVKLLVDHGADVKDKINHLWTPVHVASKNDHLEIVQYLVDNGADDVGEDEVKVLKKAIEDDDVDSFHCHLERLVQDHGSTVGDLLAGSGALHCAAKAGSIPMVETLIQKGLDVNTKSVITDGWKHEWSPLHVASENGHLEMVQYLVDHGADVDIKDDDGKTPLLVAAVNGKHDIVKCLVNHGANVNIKDNNNDTPLDGAAFNEHLESVKYLVSQGAVVTPTFKDWTPLYQAAMRRNVEIVRILADLGADINTKPSARGWTPLHRAVEYRVPDLVRCLVDRGADVNIKDYRSGNSPLRLAMSTFGLYYDNLKDNYHADIVEYLAIHGADVHTKYGIGRTPLLLAAVLSHHGTVRCLQQQGADINIKDENGWTPLLYAARNGSFDTVRCLVDLGADVKINDGSGATPLHWACYSGNAKMVSCLMEKGLKPATKDGSPSGKNSLSWAIQSRHNDVAAALLDYKCDDDDKDGWKESLRSSDSEGITHMRDLIAFMPDVAEKAFSKCVETNGGKQGQKEVHAIDHNFHVRYDYEFLEDFQESHSSDTENSNADSWRPKKFTKSNHPLNLIMKHGHSNLLKHPLVISLLEYKWTTFGQYIFFANFFLYLIFLSFLTAFGLVVLSPLETTCVEVLNGSFNGTVPENCEGLSIHEYRFLFIGAAVTILTALLRLAIEIIQLCRHPQEYLQDWVNWLEIPLYLFSIMFTFVFATPCLCVYRWQWQIGVVAVFLGWIGLITFLQKWPVTGVYILMFVNIIVSFLKIAFLALLLVIAFALAFYMLLYEPDEMRNAFSNPGRAIVKVMAMTTGELDYDDLYHQQEGEDEIAFPPVSFLLWIIFLVLMPVLLSNLLVGLAVGDVDRLQKVATENRIALQIDLVLSLEELLESLHLRQRFVIPYQQSKFYYPNTPETLLPNWCKRGTCDEDLVENKKPSRVRKWIAKLYSKWWITNDYSASGVNVSNAIKPRPDSTEEQLQYLEARLKVRSEQQSEQLDSKLKEMSKQQSEQLDSKLKKMNEQFQEHLSKCYKEQANKMEEHTKKMEEQAKRMTEEQTKKMEEQAKRKEEQAKRMTEEQTKRMEEQAKRMTEEQTKRMEEQTKGVTEQLSGEVASLKEALEKLITQMATK